LGRPLERAGMDRYQEKLPPIYAAHHGYRLVMGGESGGVRILSGGLGNLSAMLARFPSPDQVSDFWWSDAYREAYVHRKNAGRFAAVGLPGLDRAADPIPGGHGYLLISSNPEKPSQWRKFADAFIAALGDQGGTIMVDAGPEAVERLESLMPGSHFIVCQFASMTGAEEAWAALSEEFSDLRAPCEPVNAIALDGLSDNHPWRLTEERVTA
jgi:uncharacterized protein (DUF1330 family)